MPLTLRDLPTASRLLDEALELAPAQLEPWLAALPVAHRHLAPMLREMLAEYRVPQQPGFMAAGPQLVDAADDHGAARAGELLGPYRLIREVGRGGMSTVWLAERPDGVVKRSVALKMPLLTLTSPTQVERFERERDVLAMLNHPQIARLYDAGVAPSGQPYIVLEYVEGLPITSACDVRTLDVAARLRLFLQVLAAVDHAHKHLVVHRDIKPSNVFVGADGQVKLLDFGIAKLLVDPANGVEATALTREGGCVLTPRYAAPEQVDGRPISTATDVYSLGALLHELLVGQPPHADAQGSVVRAVNALVHAEPTRPSLVAVESPAAVARGFASADRLRVVLAGDLDTIVLKALRKEPAERYSSVERFAEDIACYLASRPIAARPPSLARRARLFVQRHRAAAAASAIGAAAAVALAVLLGQQHALTVAQEARASAVRDFMMDMLEDAEPDELHNGTEVTGKQMVEGGLHRAQDRFGDRPQLLGDVLSQLGRMLLRLGEGDRARQVLAQASAVLERSAPPDDPALNKTRVLMAGIAFDANDMGAAQALAAAALAGCSQTGPECAKARAYASGLLAPIAGRNGDPRAALAHMRASVADTALGFGEGHAETAMAWNELAVTARDAGELLEADRAVRQALAVAGQVVLRASDKGIVLRTQALIALELGRFAEAANVLTGLISRSTERDEQALQRRLLSNAELALGHADAALAAADQALSMADPAGADPEALFARQARARALSLQGHADAALAEMQIVEQGLAAARYAPNALPVLRAQRLVAEMLARHGKLDAAWDKVVPVVQALAGTAGGSPVERGLALDLQGCIERDRGRPGTAATLHEQAHALLALQLPEAHPFLARNVLYQERARSLVSNTPEAAARFQGLADAYSQRFGPASDWSRLIAAQRDPAACHLPTRRACALLL